MEAFEIGHLGGVAGLGQRLVAGLDQLDQAAAEHDLLAEEIGLALFLEGGLDDAGAAAAIGRGVGEAEVMGVAGRVLVDRDQGRHAAAALILGADGVAGALRGDHQHVEVLARLDQVEMDVEAVREQEGGAFLHVGVQFVAIDVALQLVRGQHHHDVRDLGGLRRGHHLEAGLFGLLARGRAGLERDDDVLDAGIAQVERVGMALRAVADDADLLALDQVDVGITIVINAHGCLLCHALVLSRPEAISPVP